MEVQCKNSVNFSEDQKQDSVSSNSNRILLITKHIKDIEDFYVLAELVEEKLIENPSLTLTLHTNIPEVKCEPTERETAPIVVDVDPSMYFPSGDEKIENDSFEDSNKTEVDEYTETVRKSETKQGKNEGPFTCEKCEKTFGKSYLLKRHFRNVHVRGKKLYTCKICGFMLETSHYEAYFNHKQECEAKQSGNTERYLCGTCGKTFSTLKKKNGHVGYCNFKHGYSTKVWNQKNQICSYENCDYRTSTKKYLENHINRVHLNLPLLKEHTCSFCGKCYNNNRVLTDHMNQHHYNIRPHVCNLCGKGFAVKQKLVYHMEIHSDNLKYPCAYCGKAFKQSATMYKHKKSCSLNPDKNTFLQ